eukprot:2423002-Prymnesium_polylepis.1
MPLPMLPPKISSTILTFVPTCFGLSLLCSQTMLRGPSLPDSPTIWMSSSGRSVGMHSTSA